MSALTISQTYRQLALYQIDDKAKPSSHEKTHPTQRIQQTPSSYVILSKEAKEKSQQENNTLNNELAQQIKLQAADTTEKLEAVTKKDGIDTMIEQLKELIKEIQRRLKALRNKKGEAEKVEIKMLEAQLITLNGNLMALIGKKFDAVNG